jgi:hypothetical protein
VAIAEAVLRFVGAKCCRCVGTTTCWAANAPCSMPAAIAELLALRQRQLSAEQFHPAGDEK